MPPGQDRELPRSATKASRFMGALARFKEAPSAGRLGRRRWFVFLFFFRPAGESIRWDGMSEAKPLGWNWSRSVSEAKKPEEVNSAASLALKVVLQCFTCSTQALCRLIPLGMAGAKSHDIIAPASIFPSYGGYDFSRVNNAVWTSKED